MKLDTSALAQAIDAATFDTSMFDSIMQAAKLDTSMFDSITQAAKLDTSMLDSITQAAKLDTSMLDSIMQAAKLDTSMLDSIMQAAKLDTSALAQAIDAATVSAPVLDRAAVDELSEPDGLVESAAISEADAKIAAALVLCLAVIVVWQMQRVVAVLGIELLTSARLLLRLVAAAGQANPELEGAVILVSLMKRASRRPPLG